VVGGFIKSGDNTYKKRVDMNEEIRVTMLSEPTPVKPETDEEKQKWSTNLGKAPNIDLNIEDLATSVGELRHSFCHAVFFDRWICQANFRYSQLIIVDVDEILSPQNALSRLEELDMPMPNIIYRTLSDPTDPLLSTEEKLKQAKKFRMIFVLDKPVYDFRKYEAYVKQGMYILFPESDHVSATQKWLGGQEVIYLDTESRLNPTNLMCIADVYDARCVETPCGRKKRFRKKYDKLPPSIFHDDRGGGGDVGVSKNATSYSIYKDSAENETSRKSIRNFDWAEVANEFELFGAFYRKERKIFNPELLGLYSGMRRIEGGALLWKKLVKGNDLINKRHLAIPDWFNTQFKKGKNPWEQLISEYAPNDSAGLEHPRLTDIHFKQGYKAIKLKNIPEIPIEEAQMKMQKFIKKFLESDNIKFGVCKAATALGKTKFILENAKPGCLICVPTHKLALQHANDLKKLGIEFLIAPEVPPLPKPIQAELDRYRSTGDNMGAARFLKRMKRVSKSMTYGLSGKEAFDLKKTLKKYFDDLKKCTESKLPVIITHKRLLFTPFPNHDTVIIDEDIIPALFETGSFTSKDLRILISALKRRDYPGCSKDLNFLDGLLYDITSNSRLMRHVHTTSGGKTEVFENYLEMRL
jgi:hypothetical protein